MTDQTPPITPLQPDVKPEPFSRAKRGRYVWCIRIEWKLPDFWVGVFWRHATRNDDPLSVGCLHVWFCLVPCVPIHIWKEYALYE